MQQKQSVLSYSVPLQTGCNCLLYVVPHWWTTEFEQEMLTEGRTGSMLVSGAMSGSSYSAGPAEPGGLGGLDLAVDAEVEMVTLQRVGWQHICVKAVRDWVQKMPRKPFWLEGTITGRQLLMRFANTTDALDLEEAAREFIVNSEHRQRIFGAF